jgi:MerR family redox-sensitive transcriptional activator SoxR
MTEDMPIGEVARQAGLRTSALRYYESIGLLPAPRRVNGRRRYGLDAVRQLQVLQFAQQAGFTIAEMQTLFNGFAPGQPPKARFRALAQQKLGELDQVIARARQMQQVLESGLACGCVRLEDCELIARTGPYPGG